MMTPSEALDAYIAALRSGKYPQTKGRLRREGMYCAEGILCELAAADGVCTTEDFRTCYGVIRSYIVSADESSSSVAPPTIRRWAGLPAYDSFLQYTDSHGLIRRVSLLGLNDYYCETFPEIADRLDSWRRQKEGVK